MKRIRFITMFKISPIVVLRETSSMWTRSFGSGSSETVMLTVSWVHGGDQVAVVMVAAVMGVAAMGAATEAAVPRLL